MPACHLFTVLIILTTLFTYINHQFIKWPATIAVTIFSLVISVALLLLQNTLPQLNYSIIQNIRSVQFS
ncbi:MAG: hypothetical protein ICV81_12945, partial [Flavisolibacter sp.]|nr:hypothetical protein [Flavisolibacter sp.]